MIIRFDEKKDCCGCAACMNECPKHAITMKDDADGFIFPQINNDLCVECGLCEKVCSFQNRLVDTNEPLATYVAINKDPILLKNSTSGGVFAAISSIVFEKSGIVFGCAFNNDLEPMHISVDNPTDMKKLQGSKYVQSNINTTYNQAEEYLEEGRWVLFTGTPCQIAGLKSYLGKDYDTLITADIICHGVPSAAFFKGYIKFLESKLKGKAIDFKFRDKSKSSRWVLIGKMTYVERVIYERSGIIREKSIPSFSSYYYSYFLKGNIQRENCYECKYATTNRQGDFTLGDYWGVEKAHPEIKTENGVSVLLVNSTKGIGLVEKLGNYLVLTKSTLEQAREQNEQLRQPIPKSNKRKVILKSWREGGYEAVANAYYKENKKQFVIFGIKALMPESAKKIIKKFLG